MEGERPELERKGSRVEHPSLVKDKPHIRVLWIACVDAQKDERNYLKFSVEKES